MLHVVFHVVLHVGLHVVLHVHLYTNQDAFRDLDVSIIFSILIHGI